MSSIKSKEDRIGAAISLDADLKAIETWANTWNVLFGAAKCKATTISNRRDASYGHPSLHFFGTTLEDTDSVDLLGLTVNKDLSWTPVVNKMARTASQRLGLLRRAAPYLVPSQRATIYKTMIRSKMEYASSAWMGAPPTSLSKLDAIQRRAVRIIGISEDDGKNYQIQHLGHRRAVGAITLFHRMFYGEAPELLQHLLPDRMSIDPRLRRSVRSHDQAVKISRSNLVSHQRSFLPTSAHLWNALPGQITSNQNRLSFKREVNNYLGANPSALSL